MFVRNNNVSTQSTCICMCVCLSACKVVSCSSMLAAHTGRTQATTLAPAHVCACSAHTSGGSKQGGAPCAHVIHSKKLKKNCSFRTCPNRCARLSALTSRAACQSLSNSTAAPAAGMSVPRPQEAGVIRHSLTGQSGCFRAGKDSTNANLYACVCTCVIAV